ncbi:hypothetical protein VCRA2120O256_380017 [Vibrio crassostreae]|nr:hypothetical protein VCHA55O506_20505 [Vibrio chagasii]CAK2085411.1 hypothetical protein VCRA2113O207_410018 [Vibrio crassostreae]CAK2111783.1 hypothetical protein VCRA2113O213_420017 [Vibrio crassostreae]CAK2116361.1 hypothetical protein VCRA2113O222_420019 [Vibrio crassostreae]CAK2127260.1 hypothetical protein VCRA2113O227_410017 [Vibrio crassostreae]
MIEHLCLNVDIQYSSFDNLLDFELKFELEFFQKKMDRGDKHAHHY